MVVGAIPTVKPEKVQELVAETPVPSASSEEDPGSTGRQEDNGAAAVADILGEDAALSEDASPSPSPSPSPTNDAAPSPSPSPTKLAALSEEDCQSPSPPRTHLSPLQTATKDPSFGLEDDSAIAAFSHALPALLEDNVALGATPLSPAAPQVAEPAASGTADVADAIVIEAALPPVAPFSSAEAAECAQDMEQNGQVVSAKTDKPAVAETVLCEPAAGETAETAEFSGAPSPASASNLRAPSPASASREPATGAAAATAETTQCNAGAAALQEPASSSGSGGYCVAGGDRGSKVNVEQEVQVVTDEATQVPSRTRALTAASNVTIGPPESVDPASIYKLYRGTICQIDGEHLRVWVEFPALQLCRAGYDLPARAYDRLSLLDLTSCQVEMFDHSPSQLTSSQWTRVDIYADTSVGTGPLGGERKASQREGPTLSIIGPLGTLQEFGEALQQLLSSREKEGQRGLEFIQKRLFQYLWKHQGSTRSSSEHYEAQAVLAFNLEPKEGVAYLKSKLNKRTEKEIGEWIALMATQKGGLDPTLLGNYFSRRDTLEIFRAFVRCLDFHCTDIVVALRKLFDTFKPGGEGQVITRILEYFSEAYFDQWKSSQDDCEPRVAYGNPDSVLQVAVSLIMLNTGLHVATKKVNKKSLGAIMTVDQYISNTRGVLGEAEVPEQALRVWYEAVRGEEISVEPLPRADFSKLPVQPDIEGWLIAVLGPQTQHRFWAVLALQRLYLFSDASEVEPGDAIDLKDLRAVPVSEDGPSKDRFSSDLQRSRRGSGLICQCFASRDRAGIGDLQDAEMRAFEVSHAGKRTILQKLSTKPRTHLALVAESPDLMEKWVNLIAAGPY